MTKGVWGFVANIIYLNRFGTVQKLNMLKFYSSEEIVKQYNPDGIYPFNIKKIYDHMDIPVIPYDFKHIEQNALRQEVETYGKISGAVVATDDKMAVFYSYDSNKPHIRFTLAHELAHCCLNLNLDTASGRMSHIEFRNACKNNITAEERNANIFAGEILIPTEPLNYVISNLICPSVYYLSKFFGVSENVMSERLKYLGYI